MAEEKSFDEVMSELKQEHDVNNLLSFNEINIQDKLSTNSSLYWHYTELYYKEKNDLDKILELLDKVRGERYKAIKDGEQGEKRQTEIEKYYLPADTKVCKITSLARQQRWRVDFYDGLRKAIDKMSWSMQTFLKGISQGL